MKDKLLLFKEITGSYGRPVVEFEEEIKLAKDSIYFWFYVFLRLNKDYKNMRIKPFGSTSLPFHKWWKFHGRYLFAEQLDKPPSVQVINLNRTSLNPNYYVVPKEDLTDENSNNHPLRSFPQSTYKKSNVEPKWLAIEIPLFIKKSAVNNQIKKILDEYHPNKKIKLRKHSTAKLKILDNRMRWETFKKIFMVYLEVDQNPDTELWKIGERLMLSPAFNLEKKDNLEEQLYKQRLMKLVVQRYLREANALIINAGKGIFPKKTLN